MLVFNQQANIKNVNGAIADNFANRPAAQGTFYLFYSLDTQEIYYDNGTWILISAAGGTPVNIYNSDGTLTGNRTLSGANNNLEFADLLQFITSVGGNNVGFKLDFSTNLFSFGDFDTNFNGTNFLIDDTNQLIKTQSGGNDKGLTLDFANNRYSLGTDLNFGIGGFYVDTNLCNTYVGDGSNNYQGVNLQVNNNPEIIKTQHFGNDIGLKLDFANNEYYFGDILNTNFLEVIGNSLSLYSQSNRIKIDGNNNEISTFCNNQYIGLFANPSSVVIGDTTLNNSIFFDLINNLITTKYLGNDIGLKLDFANNQYILGDEPNGNRILYNANNGGFFVGYNYQYVIEANAQNFNIVIGDANYAANQTQLFVLDTNQIIKTSYQGNDIGLKLDFPTSIYQFGQLTGGNATKFVIDDVNDRMTTSGTSNQPSGLDIYPNLRQFYFGVNASNNLSHLFINDASQIATFNSGGFVQGVDLNFSTHKYRFGRFNGGNTTQFTIDDAAAYAVQIDGTGVTSGTSGGVSGLHLKIKVNGVDYKIELRNP